MTDDVDPDPYLINDVPLWNLARELTAVESPAPEWRDTSLVVPQAHGELDVGSDPSGQRRPYGASSLKLAGWVQGVDPDTGVWLGDAHSLGLYYQRVSELVRLLSARTLVVQHVRPDGNRFCDGYRVGSFAPAREPSSPWFGRWQVTIKIPSGFWYGASTLTAQTAGGGVASGNTISLAAFQVAEAPIADGIWTFGPGANPLINHAGTFVGYDGVIAPGRSLVIDCARPEIRAGAGAVWTPDEGLLRYGPGPSWWELDPTAAPIATLTHTGGGLMSASYSAKPKYLTS